MRPRRRRFVSSWRDLIRHARLASPFVSMLCLVERRMQWPLHSYQPSSSRSPDPASRLSQILSSVAAAAGSSPSQAVPAVPTACTVSDTTLIHPRSQPHHHACASVAVTPFTIRLARLLDPPLCGTSLPHSSAPPPALADSPLAAAAAHSFAPCCSSLSLHDSRCCRRRVHFLFIVHSPSGGFRAAPMFANINLDKCSRV